LGRKSLRRTGCDERGASLGRPGSERCAVCWKSMDTALSTSPHRGAWLTRSTAHRVGLNVMRFAASTFVCPARSAQPERRGGEHRGGTVPRARCSPLAMNRLAGPAISWWAGGGESAAGKPLSRRRLPLSRTGGALCRPLAAGSRTLRSVREVWRERPRVCPLALPGLRPARGRSRHGSRLPSRFVRSEIRGWSPPRNRRCILPRFRRAQCRGTSGRSVRVSPVQEELCRLSNRAPVASR